MAKAKATTVRHGHRVTKGGQVRITTTKPAKGLVGKLLDKALKSSGR